MADDPHSIPTAARPGDPLDLATSVAGEEDPGASFDTIESSDKVGARAEDAGETVCPHCGGSGRLGASACPVCEGTGKVAKAIGGG